MSETTDLLAYVQLLQRHDWAFQFSDDHSVYCRGRDQRDALRRMQPALDADWAIWNDWAPEDARHPKAPE